VLRAHSIKDEVVMERGDLSLVESIRPTSTTLNDSEDGTSSASGDGIPLPVARVSGANILQMANL
jgi:hypothetical protein